MKIYTIQHKMHNYDAYMGHAVVAKTKEEVIKLAKSISCDEGWDVWNTAEIKDVGIYTGIEIEPFILLSDYNAG